MENIVALISEYKSCTLECTKLTTCLSLSSVNRSKKSAHIWRSDDRQVHTTTFKLGKILT